MHGYLRVLNAFNLHEVELMQPYGSGLINHTWKITTSYGEFILQKINHQVFKKPESIAFNIRLIANYLNQQATDYFFVEPLPANNGSDLVHNGEGYFRMFPFVSNSCTINVVESAGEAYEAARQFGKFTRLLSELDKQCLKTTIPDFHNLSLRYNEFLAATENGDPGRIAGAEELIRQLRSYSDIVMKYEAIRTDPEFRIRVTHHDTKISNVLFDDEKKGLCVIDLDTVMPGYFISDVGDMMRTYLSPVSEEETDLNKISIREDIYEAIVKGYLSEMKGELTPTEAEHFFYAGKFMIYMQALRYLTDHLNKDIYYGAKYEGQNLARAMNQYVLLRELVKKEEVLSGLIPVI
jgi:Ser/Thr protein kinase RdoA (MazF antagonist)